jgi:hypothetical protein
MVIAFVLPNVLCFVLLFIDRVRTQVHGQWWKNSSFEMKLHIKSQDKNEFRSTAL